MNYDLGNGASPGWNVGIRQDHAALGVVGPQKGTVFFCRTAGK